MIGTTLGHYRIQGKLGAGGMGEVYRAHDEKLDRDVALKVLPAGALEDDTARARLLREARAAATLNHPHICTIHEVGEAGGRSYIAMELVEGRPLSERIPAKGLPAAEVLRIGSQVADGLSHAHDRGIVHRDLKSANVVITPDGRAKVLDFGLAKRLSGDELAEATTQSQASLTQSGALMGTLAYMAPEQLRGQPADARSDVWALGVVLYEMAAGHRPYQGQTGYELSSAILDQPPPPLPAKVPIELQAVIARCLEKEPERRYQRASEAHAALEAVQTGALAPWAARRYRLARGRWRWAAVAGLAIAAAAVGWWWLQGPVLPFEERDWVLISSFENRTGEELFNGTVEFALERELGNSRFVNVIPRERIEDALHLMRKPPDTRVDVPIGREICQRDGGIRALLAGQVEKLGGRYLLTAELIDPQKGHRVASRTEEARNQEEVLPAVRRLSNWVRKALGEVPAHIQQDGEPLEQLTTSSLLALQLYRRADTLQEPKDYAEAESLLRQAIQEDPDFAWAYTQLAHKMANQRKPPEEWRPFAQRAIELSDRVSERERLHIAGDYYALMGEREKALQAWHAFQALDPDDASKHLAVIYVSLDRCQEAAPHLVRAAELRPNSFRQNFLSGNRLVWCARDWTAARPFLARARELITPDYYEHLPSHQATWLELWPIQDLWLQGDLAEARREADRLAQTLATDKQDRQDWLRYDLGMFYIILGEFQRAEQWCETFLDDTRRLSCLSQVALAREDPAAERELLEKLPLGLALHAWARLGDAARARKGLEDFRKQVQSPPPGQIDFAQADIARSLGETDEAIALYEKSLASLGEFRPGTIIRASGALAGLWEEKGDLRKAIRVLQEASAKKTHVNPAPFAERWPWLWWMKNQEHQAELYRKLGQPQEAQKIEAELLKLLALADADHPMLTRLQRLEKGPAARGEPR